MVGARSTDRGYHTMLLEVVEQNEPAITLYRNAGFRRRRRLVGYTLPGEEHAESCDSLTEIDPLAIARVVSKEGEKDLPWLLTAETLAAQTLPVQGFAIDDRVYALVTTGRNNSIQLLSLIVPRSFRRQGFGARMVRSIRAAFPLQSLTVSPIVPEDLNPEFFEKVGFRKLDLTQLEMLLQLPRIISSDTF
jgi:ribosomal protein S18 acetylase RimI-like enzyme